MTRPRKVILAELPKQNAHPSADKIHQMVRRRIPKISLGTVYRNLEVLANMGKIKILELSGALKHYDAMTRLRINITIFAMCAATGWTMHPWHLLNQLEDDPYGATVFEIIGHNLEFTGRCPECSKKAAPNYAE